MMLRTFKASLAHALAIGALILASSCGLGEPAFATGVGPTGFNLNTTVQGDVTNTNALGSSREVINSGFPLQLSGGTGAGQMDTFYAAQITIAASGSTTLDLNGSVTDAFGNTVNLLHVKFIMVVACAGNVNDFQVGPGAANPFTGPWSGTTPLTSVSPGETMLITKGQGSQVGWPVVASTGDIVKLANSGSGTSVCANVYIGGTST